MVALERVWSNNMLEKRQDEISVTDVTGMVSSPACRRQRITARLRAEVIKHYDQGMSSRRVAAKLGLGRTTVLKILKTAEVEVRPRGRKYLLSEHVVPNWSRSRTPSRHPSAERTAFPREPQQALTALALDPSSQSPPVMDDAWFHRKSPGRPGTSRRSSRISTGSTPCRRLVVSNQRDRRAT